MPETRPSSEPSNAAVAPGGRSDRYIYIACPWTPVGGGMYKVADYLIQSQAPAGGSPAAQLRPLDTRGGGHAVFSLWVLLTALAKLVRGRLDGRLAGVHVNMGERMSLFRKSSVVAMCRLLGIPVVLHLHAQMRPFYEVLPPLLKRLTRWVFSLPASVVVIGRAARTFVTRELGVPAQRVEVVINGVPEPVQPRRSFEPGGRQRVLFVGRLCEAKGIPDLLAALARPGFDTGRLEVTLAGGGDVARYSAQAKALGIDGFVRFEGWCDQDKVARLMAAADVLVLPSHDEVLPLVVLEALAHGVAVVCTPIGEIPSVLSDGVNAYFVMPRDVPGLAEALQHVLGSPALLEKLGRNGRALYEQQLSLARFCANVARIHQRHFGIAGQPVQPATLAGEAAP
jgi:glycosyltransferase involved in cell wall biosynthesis